MRNIQGNQLRKRPVNLTLSEDLVAQARGMTNNLSAVVETLLTNYVSREREAQSARLLGTKEATKIWNTFGERSASFADEYVNL
jgi:antitoxin CcdA